MALKQANTLAPSNTSATGFALADARHIGGHKVVASLTALYALQDWQLLNPGETDGTLAVGQQWYVKGTGAYRLSDWSKRKTADGWTRVADAGQVDMTLFEIVTALPTSGINKSRIYLKRSNEIGDKNIYAEYIYTGDTSAAYDASKWEKLGEYSPEVDTSDYEDMLEKANDGVYNNVLPFDGVLTLSVTPTFESMSAASGATVKYITSTKTFAAVANGKYYMNWDGADAFGPAMMNGRAPSKEKIYIADGTAYAWNGTALVAIGGGEVNAEYMTSADVDAMFAE